MNPSLFVDSFRMTSEDVPRLYKGINFRREIVQEEDLSLILLQIDGNNPKSSLPWCAVCC